MVWFLASVVFSSAIYLVFRAAGQKLQILLPMVVINYFVCGLLGLGLVQYHQGWQHVQPSLLVFAGVIGTLFITMFNIMGLTTQKMGVTIASVVSRVSLVIPFLYFLLVEGGSISLGSAIGVGLAVIAIVLVVGKGTKTAKTRKSAWLPITVFIGYGVIDVLLKYANETGRLIGGKHLLTWATFSVAGILGIAVWIIRKDPLERGHLFWGVVLGLVNYAAIFCFFQGLSFSGLASTVLFPLNSVLIMLLSTLGAVGLLKERLTARKWWGVITAASAIYLLYFGFHAPF